MCGVQKELDMQTFTNNSLQRYFCRSPVMLSNGWSLDLWFNICRAAHSINVNQRILV